MDTNETGREPTDAELLRFWAEMDRLRMECAANHSKVDEYDLACIADNNAHKAVICRAREYLSGQRPMPPVNSDRNILKNIASWANQGVTITAMPGGAFVDDAGNLSGICVTGFPDTPAPDEVERLRAEVVEQSATITRQYELLKGVANVLKGQAGETELWSHADLPEMATRLTAEVARLKDGACIPSPGEVVIGCYEFAGVTSEMDIVMRPSWFSVGGGVVADPLSWRRRVMDCCALAAPPSDAQGCRKTTEQLEAKIARQAARFDRIMEMKAAGNTALTARVAELEAELAGRAATVGINDDLLERNGELLAALENIRAKHHGDEAYNIACDALGVAR